MTQADRHIVTKVKQKQEQSQEQAAEQAEPEGMQYSGCTKEGDEQLHTSTAVKQAEQCILAQTD